MPNSYKKIPYPASAENSLIIANNNIVTYDKILFDFTYFQTRSISIKGFNSFYEKKEDAINAVNDFFETLKNINSLNKKEFFAPQMKEHFHYNEFKEDIVIDRIENILKNGYEMSDNKIKEFERMYFEFSFNDGKRVIGTKIYDNIFSILFLDPNHLVCNESCRNIKNKMKYKIPGAFEKLGNDILQKKDFNQNEYLKMIVEDYNNNKYKNIGEIIEDLKSIIDA